MLRLLQMKPQLGDFVHFPAGAGTAHPQNLLHISHHGDIHGKLGIFVQKLPGQTAFPDKCRKDRGFPLDSQGTPADGHGVDPVSHFGGKENSLAHGLQDFPGVGPQINGLFHNPFLLFFLSS